MNPGLLSLRSEAEIQGGFTLMELMLVLTLIAIMAAMIVPEMKGSMEDALLRSSARKVVDVFNLTYSRAVSFNQLHKHDNSRVKQVIYCQAEDKPIQRSEIVKGYEYEKDKYVVIDDEDIKKVAPKTARTMEILEFVKSADVDPIYFESSYYMAPDEAGEKPATLGGENRHLGRDLPLLRLDGGDVERFLGSQPEIMVAALRETSVLFAALLGAWFLREAFNLRRAAGTAAIIAGVMALRLG